MKLRLNETEPELKDKQTRKGLSPEDAPRENIYGIELPIAICTPFNADFDGDAMAIHLVPDDEEVKEEVYTRMSPRYVNIYKKSNAPIFVPDHETLNGLALASEVVCEDPNEMEDPKEYFTSYAEILKRCEVDKDLDYRKPIVFNGKLGDEEYKNKITTPGRLRLSKILGADIDKIQDTSGKTILKWPDRISAKSGAKIYQWTYDQPDGVEKMNELQKFGLHIVTVLGNVSFDFTTLYVDTDTDTYREIRKIVDDPDLTDKQKLLMVDAKYKEYGKEIQATFDSDLKDELSRANRVKLQSIADINMPQLIISGVDEKVSVNHGSLYSGLSEKEYQNHAVENRSLQSIKQMGVPSSGCCLSQMSTKITLNAETLPVTMSGRRVLKRSATLNLFREQTRKDYKLFIIVGCGLSCYQRVYEDK